MTTIEYADGLRQIADWYEAHPEAPLPRTNVVGVYTVDTRDELAAVARMLGSCEKRFTDNLFHLSRDFGALTLDFVSSRRAVCTRRVVGTRTVPARPEHEVEEIEWDCESSIFDQAPL